ncbi:PIN domain-containing protein [Paucibacter sp. APW11]|uniref:PIN domain-containing protein n=1 Tax=Roseateles aquae TaxID=3077235 RepID=A0ABU3PBK0_9BURK|nr:PIN domain-containing protein [Paucibacter sp. APW11]MDT8999905.1 PIN domain-containing protein [Paucibacter sp. APW11]
MPDTLSPAIEAPIAVIDTQVVMDWLVFAEPSIRPLTAAIESGALRWVGTAPMQAELLHVLGRGVAAERRPDLELIDRSFARYCQQHTAEPPPVQRLLCRDPDDQMFIDLAVAVRARWLISRDRAVLALAKRARAFELQILTPAAWMTQQPAGLS